MSGPGEIYVKLVVTFPKDSKVRTLARFGAPDANLGRDLYVQMCLYCKDMLSDGFVPEEEVGALAYPLEREHANQIAKQLASVGLTKQVTKDGAPGWEVAAFLKRNMSRAEVEELSEKRAEAGRVGGQKSRKPAGQRKPRASGKQVANQGARNLPPREQSAENTDASNEASGSAEGGGRHAVADELTDAFWERHKSSTAQTYLAIRGVVRTAISNGLPRNDVARALDHLARNGVAVSGGSITNALSELRGGGQQGNRAAPAPGPSRARGWHEAGRDVQQALDNSGRELPA